MQTQTSPLLRGSSEGILDGVMPSPSHSSFEHVSIMLQPTAPSLTVLVLICTYPVLSAPPVEEK